MKAALRCKIVIMLHAHCCNILSASWGISAWMWGLIWSAAHLHCLHLSSIKRTSWSKEPSYDAWICIVPWEHPQCLGQLLTSQTKKTNCTSPGHLLYWEKMNNTNKDPMSKATSRVFTVASSLKHPQRETNTPSRMYNVDVPGASPKGLQCSAQPGGYGWQHQGKAGGPGPASRPPPH